MKGCVCDNEITYQTYLHLLNLLFQLLYMLRQRLQ